MNTGSRAIVAHIDMNSYFATVEQQANPGLRGRPIAVAGRPAQGGDKEYGRSVCAATSIEAKKYGLKSGISIPEAKTLCPALQIVTADPERYTYLARKFLKIFYRYTPEVEPYSIDECFLDFSDLYSWNEVGKICQKIKEDIRKELGERISCSIGVAENRLIAKLASGKKKPDGLVVVRAESLQKIIFSSQLSEFCGVGKRTEQSLNNVGIFTTKDLFRAPLEFLVQRFGKIKGRFLYSLVRGIDSAPRNFLFGGGRDRQEQKSMSHTYTLPNDCKDYELIFAHITRIAEKLSRRLRREGYMTCHIALVLRFDNLGWVTKGRRAPSYTWHTGRILEICRTLFSQIVNRRAIRAVGIWASNLKKAKFLPDFLLLEEQKLERATRAEDLIVSKFGDRAIYRGIGMRAELPRHIGGFYEKESYCKFKTR